MQERPKDSAVLIFLVFVARLVVDEDVLQLLHSRKSTCVFIEKVFFKVAFVALLHFLSYLFTVNMTRARIFMQKILVNMHIKHQKLQKMHSALKNKFNVLKQLHYVKLN